MAYRTDAAGSRPVPWEVVELYEGLTDDGRRLDGVGGPERQGGPLGRPDGAVGRQVALHGPLGPHHAHLGQLAVACGDDDPLGRVDLLGARRLRRDGGPGLRGRLDGVELQAGRRCTGAHREGGGSQAEGEAASSERHVTTPAHEGSTGVQSKGTTDGPPATFPRRGTS